MIMSAARELAGEDLRAGVDSAEGVIKENAIEDSEAGEGADRETGYYVAHIVLIVVNLVIAVYLGRLGWRVWRATSREEVAR